MGAAARGRAQSRTVPPATLHEGRCVSRWSAGAACSRLINCTGAVAVASYLWLRCSCVCFLKIVTRRPLTAVTRDCRPPPRRPPWSQGGKAAWKGVGRLHAGHGVPPAPTRLSFVSRLPPSTPDSPGSPSPRFRSSAGVRTSVSAFASDRSARGTSLRPSGPRQCLPEAPVGEGTGAECRLCTEHLPRRSRLSREGCGTRFVFFT